MRIVITDLWSNIWIELDLMLPINQVCLQQYITEQNNNENVTFDNFGWIPANLPLWGSAPYQSYSQSVFFFAQATFVHV